MSELAHFDDIDSFVWYEKKISDKKDYMRFSVSFMLTIAMALIITRLAVAAFKPAPAMILVTSVFLIIFVVYIFVFIYTVAKLKIWFAFNKDELLIKDKSDLVERMNWDDILHFEVHDDEIDIITPMPYSKRYVIKAEEDLISQIKDVYEQSHEAKLARWLAESEAEVE
jgi:hypothetical protein